MGARLHPMQEIKRTRKRVKSCNYLNRFKFYTQFHRGIRDEHMEEPITFFDRLFKKFKVFAIHLAGSLRDRVPII